MNNKVISGKCRLVNSISYTHKKDLIIFGEVWGVVPFLLGNHPENLVFLNLLVVYHCTFYCRFFICFCVWFQTGMHIPGICECPLFGGLLHRAKWPLAIFIYFPPPNTNMPMEFHNFLIEDASSHGGLSIVMSVLRGL